MLLVGCPMLVQWLKDVGADVCWSFSHGQSQYGCWSSKIWRYSVDIQASGEQEKDKSQLNLSPFLGVFKESLLNNMNLLFTSPNLSHSYTHPQRALENNLLYFKNRILLIRKKSSNNFYILMTPNYCFNTDFSSRFKLIHPNAYQMSTPVQKLPMVFSIPTCLDPYILSPSYS